MSVQGDPSAFGKGYVDISSDSCRLRQNLGCSFPVKCRFVYAAWLALLRLPYQRCWQKLRKQTDILQESYSPGYDDHIDVT